MSSSASAQSSSPIRSFAEAVVALREGGHEEDAEKAIRAGMVAALVNNMDPYAIFDMTWPEVLRLIKGPKRPPFPGKWDFNMIGKAALVGRD